MSVEIESNELVDRMLSEKDFEITPDDLKLIYCEGKQCNPTICLRTSCKVFEFLRSKKE